MEEGLEDRRASYEIWAVRNYVEATKTKTVSRAKYQRIVRTLKGMIRNSAENSKFRFWMRSKGFSLGRGWSADESEEEFLLVGNANGSVRKVAVVEDFFDIIYSVHVGQGARNGFHAGQKRTYRAISDSYAFLPREAVTQFLLGCQACQRRPEMEHPSTSPLPDESKQIEKRARICNEEMGEMGTPKSHTIPIRLMADDCLITLNVPRLCEDPGSDWRGLEVLPEVNASRTEIQRRRKRKRSPCKLVTRVTSTPGKEYPETPGTESSGVSSTTEELSPIPSSELVIRVPVRLPEAIRYEAFKPEEVRNSPETEPEEEHFNGRNGEVREDNDDGLWSYSSIAKKSSTPQPRDLSSPMTLQETSSVHDETSSSGNKEDDDDEEDDSDDMKALPHDPERLKAFNMFVRLFVDENLDRIVPISKQPKEKIQAIIDSCTRQFPEFAERARKRIRTYLKSCRRNKRSRDPTSWPESARPTPAHLTSVQAEQILAQACENESHNAKRMRLGLEPVSQPMPIIPGCEPPRSSMVDHFSPANLTTEPKLSSHNNNNKSESPNYAKPSDTHTKTVNSSISSSMSSCGGNNGSTGASASLYRNPLSMFHPAQAFPATPLFPAPPFPGSALLHNGPTDLSMKPSSGCKPLLSHKLTATEVGAVRQLITGYRESAAFLLRSADELEQLLLHQA